MSVLTRLLKLDREISNYIRENDLDEDQHLAALEMQGQILKIANKIADEKLNGVPCCAECIEEATRILVQ